MVGGHIHMVEQLLPHEAVVAAGMPRRQTHVLVQIKGGRAGKIHHARLVQADEGLIGGNGGGAGGQPQHGVGLGDQLSGQQRRRRLPNLLGVIVNVDLHEKTSFSNRNVS